LLGRDNVCISVADTSGKSRQVFDTYTTSVVEDIRPMFLIACTAGVRFVMAKIKVMLSIFPLDLSSP